jgi:hypothetical protein
LIGIGSLKFEMSLPVPYFAVCGKIGDRPLNRIAPIHPMLSE